GHDTRLLADGGTLDSARALGVPHTALAGDIRGSLSLPGGMVSGKTDLNATARALAGLANRHTADWMHQTLEAARGCDALLVSGLISFVGLSVAQRLHLPLVGLSLIPITPTAAFPSPFLPPRVPRWLNRASHHLVNAVLWRAFR